MMSATKLYLHTLKSELSTHVAYLVSTSNTKIASTTSLFSWLQANIALVFTDKNPSTIKLSVFSISGPLDIVRTYLQNDSSIASEVFIPSGALIDTVTEL
jgi:hypothetical protein